MTKCTMYVQMIDTGVCVQYQYAVYKYILTCSRMHWSVFLRIQRDKGDFSIDFGIHLELQPCQTSKIQATQ